MLDLIIVGGGPAGLTAAIYAARFHLSVMVVDAGQSRAAQIPCTRNHAGFPGGISGEALLGRMREQADEYGLQRRHGRVLALGGGDRAFTLDTDFGPHAAAAVLIATGVSNHRPSIDDSVHDRAVQAGRLRYCPICDGYEVTDQNVAVIGAGARGAKEAEFLRAYTRHVSLIAPDGDDGMDEAQRRHLAGLGIKLVGGPAHDFRLTDDGLALTCAEGRLTFEAVYPAMGSAVHSDLVVGLGADRTDEGCIRVDAHQRTSVPGLYAAGDVVLGLDQISHAMGEAGVAATTIRNDLAASTPRLR